MDLIRNDIIIDKMAMFSVGTSYVITKMSFVCRFHDIELLDNKGTSKRDVANLAIRNSPTRLRFWYRCKSTCICLVIKYVCPTLPLAAVCKR